jgi:hypothetical protein
MAKIAGVPKWGELYRGPSAFIGFRKHSRKCTGQSAPARLSPAGDFHLGLAARLLMHHCAASNRP